MNLPIGSARWSALKIIVAGLLLALLSACSAVKLAYNNGHELAWWWLTDYIDVKGEDRATLRQAVHQLHEWHRREQLPTYVEMLRRWQGRTILNPGSVGLTFQRFPTPGIASPPWAEYAIVEVAGGGVRVDLRCVPVDLDALTADVAASGMPHQAWWLRTWWGR